MWTGKPMPMHFTQAKQINRRLQLGIPERTGSLALAALDIDLPVEPAERLLESGIGKGEVT